MEPDCILELRLKRPFGEKDTVLATNLGPEYRLMPAIESVVLGEIAIASFEDTVKVMKQRELSAAMVKDAAARLGRLMAERLEDEQGWHGDDRKERTRAIREGK